MMETNDDKDYESKARIATIFAAILGCIGAIFFVLGLIAHEGKKSNQIDYNGNANGLWALAGLLLVYAAFMSQQRELRLQRKELKVTHKEMEMTREELKGQRKQFELQTENLRKQAFESSLFNMISLLGESRNKWETVHKVTKDKVVSRENLSGAENIRFIWKRIYRDMDDPKFKGKSEEFIYKSCFGYDQNWFVLNNSQHFKLIEEIVEYIINELDQDRYLSILFLQLTTSEILLTRAYWIVYREVNILKHIEEFTNFENLILPEWSKIRNIQTFEN